MTRRKILGYSMWHGPTGSVKLRVAPKTIQVMKEKVQRITGRSGGIALSHDGQISLRYCVAAGSVLPGYPENPNGSTDHIAGICSEDGRVFGLMPNPAANMLATNNRQWQKLGLKGEGVRISQIAMQAFRV